MLGIAIALAFGNPYSNSWPLKCPLYWITGLQCPFCGSQRALHELAHGNFYSAWKLNAGFMLCLPYVVLVTIGQLYEPAMKWKLMKWCYEDRVLFTVAGLMLLWGILRNL